jgi:hypothetical protein
MPSRHNEPATPYPDRLTPSEIAALREQSGRALATAGVTSERGRIVEITKWSEN